MLNKMVDGKEIILSEIEERQIRAFWALNDSYPEYIGQCGWDSVSDPLHNMVECRKYHKQLVSNAFELAKADLDKQIEISLEEENENLVKFLLEQRKKLREHLDMDFSNCNTVEELRSSIPEILKPHWNK